MNRLWIRLSLAFAGLLLVAFLVLGVTIRLIERGSTSKMPPEVSAYFEAQRERRGGLLDLTTVLAVTAVLAIGAGIWLSSRLTAPLETLGEAAEAIGRQDWNQRVPVEGTIETQTMARRFNEMASQLEQAETLRRNLLADVAHELRNPLHVLQGNLQAILDGVYPLSPEEVARLADQTRHLTALVDDLHELAQAEAHELPLNWQSMEIADLVKETAASFKPLAAARDVTLQVELLGALLPVSVDRARLRQVVANLLSNALRHTPDGGKILVSLEKREGMLELRVADSGSGITAADLPHVFDRFYRTDSARSRDRGGTGLGLAIVRAIAEAHGGTADVRSEGTGQGSTFTIRLPLVQK